MRAAFDGAQEIGFAILATTIALVAVFVPVAFLTGRVGRLFNEFGIAVAVSVAISGFVALTLTPMLCSRLLKRSGGPSLHDPDELSEGVPAEHAVEAGAAEVEELHGWRAAFDRFFHGLHVAYERALRWVLGHRRGVMTGALGLLVAIAVLFRFLPAELVPVEDRGMIFNIVLAPEG